MIVFFLVGVIMIYYDHDPNDRLDLDVTLLGHECSCIDVFLDVLYNYTGILCGIDEILWRYKFQSQAVTRIVSALNDLDLDFEIPCVWTCQVTPQPLGKKKKVVDPFNCQDLIEANLIMI